MITGDNINTAISVSKICGMIDIEKEEVFECEFNEKRGELGFNYTSLNPISRRTMARTRLTTNLKGKKHVGAIDNLNFEKIVLEEGLDLTKPILISESQSLKFLAEKVQVFARMNPY